MTSLMVYWMSSGLTGARMASTIDRNTDRMKTRLYGAAKRNTLFSCVRSMFWSPTE